MFFERRYAETAPRMSARPTRDSVGPVVGIVEELEEVEFEAELGAEAELDEFATAVSFDSEDGVTTTLLATDEESASEVEEAELPSEFEEAEPDSEFETGPGFSDSAVPFSATGV